MDHVGILETAHDLQNRIHLADVTQKLVPQTLAFTGPLHNARDVNQLQRRGHNPLRSNELRDPLQAAVGNWHHPLVRFDGAERIIRALRLLRTGEGIEQGALTHVGQTDDSRFHDGDMCLMKWIGPTASPDSRLCQSDHTSVRITAEQPNRHATAEVAALVVAAVRRQFSSDRPPRPVG